MEVIKKALRAKDDGKVITLTLPIDKINNIPVRTELRCVKYEKEERKKGWTKGDGDGGSSTSYYWRFFTIVDHADILVGYSEEYNDHYRFWRGESAMDGFDLYDDTQLYQELHNVFSQLFHLQLNKHEGIFTLHIETSLTHNLQFELYKMMSAMAEENECERITFHYEKCCVCFDLTKTKTGCGHHVCWECISKLKTERDECGDFANCPLCRDSLQSVHY